MSARVLVIQHEDKAPAGRLLPWLERVGVQGDLLPAHQGYAVPADLRDHAALIVLGGSMGAAQDQDHRWLLPTRALIAGTIASGRPFLGVCLGHQLATLALGGQVGPHPVGQTIGLRAWLSTDEGTRDPLTSALATGTEVFHWNSDITLRLPERATLLATSADGSVQAARFGPLAWGVQFHPEVDADLVMGWAQGRDAEAELAAIRSLRGRQDQLHRDWEHLVRRFGELVSAATPEPV